MLVANARPVPVEVAVPVHERRAELRPQVGRVKPSAPASKALKRAQDTAGARLAAPLALAVPEVARQRAVRAELVEGDGGLMAFSVLPVARRLPLGEAAKARLVIEVPRRRAPALRDALERLPRKVPLLKAAAEADTGPLVA